MRNQLPFWPGFLKSSFLSFLSKRKEIGRKGITWRALLKASFKVADLGWIIMKLTYIFGARLKAQYFHIIVKMKSIEPKWKAFNHNYLMPKIYGLDQSMILTKIEAHVDVSFFVPFLRNVSWYFVYYNFDTCIKNCIKVISIHIYVKRIKM